MVKRKRPFLPDWVGRLPFPPEKKEPALIRPDMEVSTIYGNAPHQIPVHKYLSTDRLTCGDFIVPMGSFFDPPDVHPGDEFYYMLEGTGTVFNPQSGDAYQVRQGEAFLIRGQVWHQVFNFGAKDVKILGTIAPAIWSEEDMGSEIEYSNKARFYNPSSGDLRVWPEKEQLPSENGMIHISPSNSLGVICGEHDHTLMLLFVNTARMQVGRITVPGNLCSEPEVHTGDEFVYLLHGEMVVSVETAGENRRSVSKTSFEIREGDKLLIPENVTHRYLNLSAKPSSALFSIAPGRTDRNGE